MTVTACMDLSLGGRGIAGGGDLRLEFAIAGGVDVGEGRAGGDESLRIGDALGGAEDFQELIAFAADAAEEAGLLENERPGDERGEEEHEQERRARPSRFAREFRRYCR